MSVFFDRCIVLGGGGHAKVLIECIRQMDKKISIIAILDQDKTRWGKSIYGIPIRGSDDLLLEIIGEGAESFVVGLGGIGDNQPRKRLFDLGIKYGLDPLQIIHPTAYCSPSASIDIGTQILPGSIINSAAKIGKNVIINSGAIVEHDCVIEAHSHIATGAKLASTVHVGEGAHIGVGATIRELIHIGDRAIVGAGAVVIRDVESYTIVAGVPARKLRIVDKD